MTYIVVFRTYNNSGGTDYGVKGAFASEQDAQDYINTHADDKTTYSIAVMT